jgi:CubicO group peptidase (beta-lactamase class C family)
MTSRVVVRAADLAEQAGLTVNPSVADFSRMHAGMREYVDRRQLPMVMTLVMQGAEIIDLYAYGLRDHERQRPLQGDTIFRLYSNTKLITAVAALQLVERGLLDVDAPLAAYLPELAQLQVYAGNPEADHGKEVTELATEPCRHAPTVRELMSHSAGFVYGWEPAHPVDRAYHAAEIGRGHLSLADVVERLARIPLAYQPGTGWQYSIASDVLARLVEVCSGQSFDIYLQEHLFDPLAMRDTGFHVVPTKQDRFAANYRPADGGYEKADDPYEGVFSQPRAYLSGGGGLCGTLADYQHFTAMLLGRGTWRGERIIGADTLQLLHQNQLPPGTGVRFNTLPLNGIGFGLGAAVRVTASRSEPAASKGEYFWGGVAGTHAFVHPELNMACLCFTQLLPGFLHPFTRAFRRQVYAALGH